MDIKFLKNINPYKLGNLNRFLFLEITSNYIKLSLFKIKKPFYKKTNSSIGNNFILENYSINEINVDLPVIKDILQKFITENDIKNIPLFVGISEYQYQILSVPEDVDDVELWFLENSSSFIPGNSTNDDFIYSYEKIRDNDHSSDYLVIIARRDYIERILKTTSYDVINLLGIFPFTYSFLLRETQKNDLQVLLDFNNNKLNYIYLNSDDYRIGDLYYNTEQNSNILSIGQTGINNAIEEFIPIINSHLENYSGTINIYLSCPEKIFEIIRKIISDKFNSAIINSGLQKLNPFFINVYFTLNKLSCNPGKNFNLLPEERIADSRNFIERQASNNLILAYGFVIIILLITSYLAQNFITSKIDEESIAINNIESNSILFEKINKENEYLKLNLALLGKLKKNSPRYTEIIYLMPEILTTNSCLTNLNIKEDESSIINIEFTGLAETQQDVASIVENLEAENKFTGIRLLYANNNNQRQGSRSSNFTKDKIQFNITANYNDL